MNPNEKEKIDKLRLQGLGYKAIARELFITVDAVKGYCKRHHLNGSVEVLKLQAKASKEDNGLCLQCQKPIRQKQRGRTKKFCSDDCRYTWWNKNSDQRNQNAIAIYHFTCAYCGKHCSSYGNKQRKYCSHDCYIKARFWSEEDKDEVLLCINAGGALGDRGSRSNLYSACSQNA